MTKAASFDPLASDWHVVTVGQDIDEHHSIEHLCISPYEDDAADAICWINDDYSEEDRERIAAVIVTAPKWRAVACRLWPFIRFWGLCGASPEAIQVMLDLAELLGEKPDGAAAMSELLDRSAESVTEQSLAVAQRVVDHVKASPLMRGMLGTTREKLFKQLDDLVADPSLLFGATHEGQGEDSTGDTAQRR